MLVPVSVTIANPGSGYVINDSLLIPGGAVLVVTGTTSPQGGGITSVSILAPTPYSMAIPNPVYPTGGSGVNASFNLTWQTSPVSTPACAQSPWIGYSLIQTQNTARDGSGVMSTPSIVIPSGGMLADYLLFKAITTTAQGLIGIFWNLGSGLTLFDEQATKAATVSGTVAGDVELYTFGGGVSLPIPGGTVLNFTLQNASEKWQAYLVGAAY